jgi:hypothetical protein
MSGFHDQYFPAMYHLIGQLHGEYCVSCSWHKLSLIGAIHHLKKGLRKLEEISWENNELI